MKRIKLADFIKQGEERFGKERQKWIYVCPACKTNQCAEDFINSGMSKEDAEKYIGFSCIGRFNGESEKGCNWTLGGLFQIHEVEIEDEEGNFHKHFDLAEV